VVGFAANGGAVGLWRSWLYENDLVEAGGIAPSLLPAPNPGLTKTAAMDDGACHVFPAVVGAGGEID
jgi:hypothetical protein